MNEDLIFRGLLLLVIAIIAYLLYRWRSHDEYWQHSDDPEVYYASDEAVIIEAGSVHEQRKTGRERGGPLVLIIKDEPRDYSAQLNLKTLRKDGVNVEAGHD